MRPSTLEHLAGSHDAFLVDQFGVLLDGGAAYPWAPAALAWLAGTGKPVILLSNSGKRSAPNAARLEMLGFARGSFRLVLSSGEAAWLDLSARGMAPGTPVWLHARDHDLSAVEGLGLRLVEKPETAVLLVLAGSLADELSMDCYREMLTPAARAGIPMLCTNPDLEMLTPGGRRPGAGAIAAMYAGLGGAVAYVGKPHPLIYSVARRMLDGIAPDRILCVGDSPAHDIAGGHAAGMRTALVRTGLTADVADDALRDFCLAEAGVLPDYVLARFAAEG